ncbi:beta-lactamase/transpeptidase-like protein [Trichoderma longibrachiatum]
MAQTGAQTSRMITYFNSDDFKDTATSILNRFRVPGLAVAVVHNKDTASRAFGASAFASQPPQTAAKSMTTQTLFEIGSASMSLTAAAVALLVADERYPDVRYDAEMAELLPGQFVMPGKKHMGVTVEDILSHRTGMAPNEDAHIGSCSPQRDDAQTVTLNIRNLSTAAPIRSRHMPCRLMYTAASWLVERKTRKVFADFLDHRVFAPLGMTMSSLWLSRARVKGHGDYICPGFSWDPVTGYCCFHKTDSAAAQGAGLIVTNVDDYIKYIQAVMNQEPPFTEAVCEGLLRPRSIVSHADEKLLPLRSPALCAAGWEVFYYRGCKVVAHGGRTAGSSATSFFLPTLKFGAVIFGNMEIAEVAGELLMQEFLDEVLNAPQEHRFTQDQRIQLLGRSRLHGDAFPTRAALAGVGASQPNLDQEIDGQKMLLKTYVGEYWNPGWRGIKVKVNVRTNRLLIDCSDRLRGFTLTLERFAGQTMYLAKKQYVTGETGSTMRVEFRFEHGCVRRVGVWLEPELDDYIWFERTAAQGEVDEADS